MLEIGMGCGAHIPLLMAEYGVTYAGIDRSELMVAAASAEASRASFMCADVETTDVPPVDVCLMVNVLQWLCDPVPVFRKLHAALRRKLVIGAPTEPPLFIREIEGVQYHRAGQIAEMLRSVGFNAVVAAHDTPRRPYIVAIGSVA